MTRDEFEEYYCTNSQISRPFYHSNFLTLPCNCGEEGCQGWAAVSNNSLSVKKEIALLKSMIEINHEQ